MKTQLLILFFAISYLNSVCANEREHVLFIDGEIIVLSPILCHDDQNGALRAEGDGNPSTTFYIWSTGATTQEIHDLGAGVYTVTISDVTGGSVVMSHELENPQPLSVDLNSFSPTCSGSIDGYIELGVGGGSGMYQYFWSNGDTENSIINLSSGNYGFTIVDSNNCTYMDEVNLDEPTLLDGNSTSVGVTCYGYNDGVSLILANGGTGDYMFFWSDGQTGPFAQQLEAGQYQYTIVDANFCEYSETITISGPEQIILTEDIVNITGDEPGILTIEVNGGIAPYTAKWEGPDGFNASGFQIEVLEPGFYTVIVRDFNDCEVEMVYFIDQISSTRNSTVTKSINGFPNPVSDNFYIEIPTTIQGAYIRCIAIDGRLMWEQKKWTDTILSINTQDFSQGKYWVQIIGSNIVYNTTFIKIDNK